MKISIAAVAVAAVAVSAGLLAQAPSVAAPGGAQVRTVLDEVRAAEQAGDATGALRASRRLLELYPNEPIAQASIYQAMAVSVSDLGQAEQARLFAGAASALDPAVAGRVPPGPQAVKKRSGNGEKLQAALAVMLATVTAVQDARASIRRPAQQPQPGQPGMGPGGLPPLQGSPFPQPIYPMAPVGMPGYQVPQAPMAYPGYGPPAGQPPVGSYYQGPPPGYAPMQQPYGAPPQYAPPNVRGAAGLAPIKAVHDHSLASDGAFFGAKSCGALLAVDGASLTFSPAGGEAPLVVPASDILEIRLNTLVGTQVGAFHVLTKRGLYLQLAPASGQVGDARTAVDALRAALKL